MPFREESCRSSCIYSGPLHSHSRDAVSQHPSTRAGAESIQLIYSGRALQALSDLARRFRCHPIFWWDDDDVHNVCKAPSCSDVRSVFAKYSPFGQFIDRIDGNKCSTCINIRKGQFGSDTWRKRARFLSDIKSVLKSLFDKNAYYEQFAAENSLANTNPFTQILN